MNAATLFQLLVLSAVWGSSFMFQRIASPEFGPVPLVALRAGSAALVLLPFLMTARQMLELRQNIWPIFVLGLISTAIPFTLFSYTTLYASAGYTSLLNATVPMFSAIVAFIWLQERLSRAGLVGIAVGFLGVTVLVADRQSLDFQAGLLPVAAALVATLCYGVTASYTRLKMAQVDPLAITFGSQTAAALVLIPPSIWLWPDQNPGAVVWSSAIALGTVCTGFAFVLFYGLISRVGVEKTVSTAYLIPVFAMLWGGLFLNESITLTMLLGGGLVLCGVGITTGVLRWRV